MSEHYWHPVLRSKTLKQKPVRVTLHGQNLVVFRTQTGLACLNDMCPHRAASFSKGEVIGDNVVCPYHGWQFNQKGHCTSIPLHNGAVPARRVPSYDICEQDGLIYITKDASKARPVPAAVWDHQPRVQRLLENTATTTLADAVENVLDPIHTFFVHKGLIRGASGQPTQVRISTRIENGDLVMRFDGEEQQNGLLSRLLEGPRSHAIGRFSMPGVVDLEYWGPERLNLVTTLYFTQEHELQYKGFARMTGPKQYGFGYLKTLLFLPIMQKVISQDLVIMKNATENWVAAGRPAYAVSPLDFIRPYIDYVINPVGPIPAPREIYLSL